MPNVYSINEISKLLEDDLAILDFKFSYKQRLMWPYARSTVMQAVYIDMFNWNFPLGQKKKIIPQDAAVYLYHVLTKSPYRKPRDTSAEMLFFSSNIVNLRSPEGGYVNRLYDHFANDYRHCALIIEDSLAKQFKFLTPRQYPHVRYHDSILIKALLQSKCAKQDSADRATAQKMVRFLQERLPAPLSEGVCAKVMKNVLLISGLLPHLDTSYRKLFARLKPKIVFLEDASYGHKCHILNVCHDMGILTGEFQHGIIHKNHFAYLYNQLLQSEYAQYLPQYLLTYGEYWSAIPRTASKVVTVGNPYIVECANHLTAGPSKTRQHILFISSGAKTELLNESVLFLVDHLDRDQYEVYIRPHPAEQNLIQERYAALINQGAVKIDADNLFHSLSQADFVISFESSTVLFEALIFKPHVFIHDRPDVAYFVDPDIFTPFKSNQGLLEMILSPPTRRSNPDAMWDPHGQENFRRFISSQVGL